MPLFIPARRCSECRTRAAAWLRGSAVVCVGPLLGPALRRPYSLCFFIASTVPCQNDTTEPTPIVISALRRTRLDGLRASLCLPTPLHSRVFICASC